MKPLTTITTTPGAELRCGDEFTIAGVNDPDMRSPVTRLWHGIIRKPTPKPALRRFKVVMTVSSSCAMAAEED